jgi:Cytochrome C oxidase, cbb3-type, subunit III
MQLSQTSVVLISLAVSILARPAMSQQADLGRAEYLSSCAACHGADGKGNGPIAPQLVKQPSDLTSLAKQNGGVFPVESVYRIIDGRTEVAPHGSRDMPIWGYRFVPRSFYRQKLEEDFILAPPSSPEAVVHARILAVIDYLNRLQQR